MRRSLPAIICRPWGDIGERLENVHPNFDVYMLGKLLWCMVTGRLRLPREWHRRREYDVTEIFNTDPQMHSINEILDKCITDDPEKCLASARDLLAAVDHHLSIMSRGGQSLAEGVPRPCHVCGRGYYHAGELRRGVTGRPVVGLSMAGYPISFEIFLCDVCGHTELFKTE